MSFATAIGAEERPLRWDIPLASEDRDFAERFADDDRPLVVISPCSSQRIRNYRNWDMQNYAAVIEHLESQYDARIMLTGGTSDLEKDYGSTLASDSDAENLVGQTSLKQMAALIKAADLVICPDSGPAHMATALGTAVIGLYATSNPDRTGPYLSKTFTINRYPDAIYRYLDKNVADVAWGQRVRDPDAMGLITVQDVLQNIDIFLEERQL